VLHENLQASEQRIIQEYRTNPEFAEPRAMDKAQRDVWLAQRGLTGDLLFQSIGQNLSANQALQGVGLSGFIPASSMKTTTDAWFDQREIQWQRFDTKDYAAQVQPTDAQVDAYYKAHTAEFGAPEQAKIEYLVLDAAALAAQVKVLPEEVQQYYKDHASAYGTPEERSASYVLAKVAPNASAADVAKAKALLAEAGVPNGFEVTLDHPSTAPFGDWAQAIQANLAEIGIKATLLAGESKQVITKTRARQHQIAMVRWGSDYLDPHSNAETFNINTDNSDAQKNRTLCWRSNWKNDDFTARAIEAQKEPDAKRRVALYERLQRDHQEQSPFVILAQQVEVAAMRKTTTGLELALLSDRSKYLGVTKA